MGLLRENFDRLNALRYKQDSLWRHIPIVGFAARTLSRIRYWGVMRSLEMLILDELISQADWLRTTTTQSATGVGASVSTPDTRAGYVYYLQFSAQNNTRYEIAVQDGTMPDGSDDIVISGLKAGHSMVSPAQSFLLSTASSDWRIIDVGSHVGVFSLPAAALGCQVVAIEGSKLNTYLLSLSIQRNGFQNLNVLNAAASHEDGFATFSAWGPWGSLVQTDLLSAHGIPSLIQTISLDSLVAKLGWQSVDAVKIDVEGSEAEVLSGMKTLLARSDAPIVVFESNTVILRKRGQHPTELITLLRTCGYECYMPHYGELLALAPDHTQIHAYADYVALKPSHNLNALLERIGWKLKPPATNAQIREEIEAEVQAATHIDHKRALLQAIQDLPPRLRDDPIVFSIEHKLAAEIAALAR
jgi:FkbM family methyltransferase